jgi:hypothetical protein
MALYMNIDYPMPVNFRFITKKPRIEPGFYKKIRTACYAERDLKATSFYKPILFIA